jgi:hypothetical protein
VGQATFAIPDITDFSDSQGYDADVRGVVWTQNPVAQEIDSSDHIITFSNGAYPWNYRTYQLCGDGTPGVDYSFGSIYGFEYYLGLDLTGTTSYVAINSVYPNFPGPQDFCYYIGQGSQFSGATATPLGNASWSSITAYYPPGSNMLNGALLSFTGCTESADLANSNWVICAQGAWSGTLENTTSTPEIFRAPVNATAGIAPPATMNQFAGITHATNAADDVIVGSSSTNSQFGYYWAPGSGTTTATPLNNGFANAINTRYYVPGGSMGDVPDFQMVGGSTNNVPFMWERTRNATTGAPATPTAYNTLPVQTLVTGNAWSFGYLSSINDSSSIVSTATQVQDSNGKPFLGKRTHQTILKMNSRSQTMAPVLPTKTNDEKAFDSVRSRSSLSCGPAFGGSILPVSNGQNSATNAT